MAALEFDRLIEALQSAIGMAQRTVSTRRQGRLGKTVDIDQHGNEEGISYFFQVSGDDSGTGIAAARLPLLTYWRLALATGQPPTTIAEQKPEPLAGAFRRIRRRLTGPQDEAGEVVPFKRPDKKPRG
jgi:hypothetical protein